MTDAGIEALCGGATDEEEKTRQGYVGQCKSLRKLIIDATDITHQGVQMALRNLPCLEILDHEQLVQALGEMHQNQEVLPKYGLTFFRFQLNISLRSGVFKRERSAPYLSGSLMLVASMCPLITKVELTFFSKDNIITDQELLGLTAIKTLQEFSISWFTGPRGGTDSPITFRDGIAPVLKAHKMSLHTLKICIFPFEVDLVILMELCSNLRNLYLNCIFTPMFQDAPSNAKRCKTDLVLEKLEKLEIDYSDSENLIYLLSAAPAVTHLVFDCATLTDEMLQQTFESHSFASLRELELKGCDFLTKKGIDLFMNEGNALEKIDFRGCKSLTKKNVKEWQKMSNNNNWNLSITLM